jgi:hypothetical protein
MKRVVSISLGSSHRDHAVEVDLLGERIRIERIGTDGDMARAQQMYHELDGKVDAFGVGGTDLSLRLDDKVYPLYSVLKLVEGVSKTPVVDGGGLRYVLDRRVMQYVEAQIGAEISPKTAMITSAADRFDIARSFDAAGYDVVYCDLMFALGIPIPVRGIKNLKRLASVLLPILAHLPFSMLYPTGEKQRQNQPKFVSYYQRPSVVAGDFNYIYRHMPARMDGKVIVTNTTTAEDVEMLRKAGVRYLVTTTPRLEGRTFGTNVMEASLVALAGKGRPLTSAEIEEMLTKLDFHPTVQKL